MRSGRLEFAPLVRRAGAGVPQALDVKRGFGIDLTSAFNGGLLRRLDGTRALGVGAPDCVIALVALLDVQTPVFHDDSFDNGLLPHGSLV